MLGSVHFSGSVEMKAVSKLSTDEFLQTYRELWQKAARSHLFQIMAHPDYFKVFHKRILSDLLQMQEKLDDFVYEMIIECKEDAVIEINTSACKY